MNWYKQSQCEYYLYKYSWDWGKLLLPIMIPLVPMLLYLGISPQEANKLAEKHNNNPTAVKQELQQMVAKKEVPPVKRSLPYTPTDEETSDVMKQNPHTMAVEMNKKIDEKQKNMVLLGDDFLITRYNIALEIDHPDNPKIIAPGLGRKYNERFIRDIKMQGSGIDNDGRKIQLNWMTRDKNNKKVNPTKANNGLGLYTYVDEIKTTNGRIVSEDSVAVDPRIIPLGSRIYIEGIGERIATDTGDKIKGHHIDVFMNVPRKQALKLNRNVKVWIINDSN